MRKLLTVMGALALILVGFTAGTANDRDETIMTVQVSSADHELLEGYFTLETAPRSSPSPDPTSISSWRASADAR